VPRGSVADPLNLLQIMLAKGSTNPPRPFLDRIQASAMTVMPKLVAHNERSFAPTLNLPTINHQLSL
jgi:hypothetical protein